MVRVQSYTLRLRSSKFGAVLRGDDAVGLEEYLEMVNLEDLVWKSGQTVVAPLFIDSLVIMGMNRFQ